MELRELQLRPVSDNFNGLPITVNVNAVTGRHFRAAAGKIKAAMALAKKEDQNEKATKRKLKGGELTVQQFEGRGRATEAICALYASLLKGTNDEPLLMDWELTNNGKPVPCTEDELKNLHPDLLKDLYEFCLRVDHPKGPRIRTIATSRTTSVSTVASTRIPDTPMELNPSTLSK